MPTFSLLVRTAFFMTYELEATNCIIRRNGAHTKHMKEMEQYLICHCSPTLASIKTANLFSCSFERQEDFAECIAYWNKQMHPKGIAVTVLQQKPNWALVYVYRMAQLQKDLQKPGVSCFLEQYGYVDLCVEKALEHLQKRIAASDGFPHEIGIFLDYPLADVIGFIENQGCNCKCSGCWKVYQNEEDALETFARYKKCTRIYTELWMQGRSINKLTVSA